MVRAGIVLMRYQPLERAGRGEGGGGGGDRSCKLLASASFNDKAEYGMRILLPSTRRPTHVWNARTSDSKQADSTELGRMENAWWRTQAEH